MEIFVLLTRLILEEQNPALGLLQRERAVTDHIRKMLPSVRWKQNYAVTGPWDYLDVFEAPDTSVALKVAAIVRHYGGAHAEIWPAQEWDSFEQSLQKLAGDAQNLEAIERNATP